MKYLLDTNICIHFFRGRFELIKKLDSVELKNCAISEITLAEFFDSIYIYGKEKVRLRKLGIMISDFDLLVGCTSVEKELVMVTENIREFERISDIKIENWVNRK